MKSRATSLGLMAAMLLSLLAGCTGDASSSYTGQTNQKKSEVSSRSVKNTAKTERSDDFSYRTDKNSTSSSSVKYKARQTCDSDTSLSGKMITSSRQNENVILVKKGSRVLLENVTVSKKVKGASDSGKAGPYGTGSAILGISGTTYIKNSRITTAADDSSGILSCGNNQTGAENSTVITKKKNSDGVTAARIGTLYAKNLKVTTRGPSSSPLVNNYGTLAVKGGTYTSAGKESPAVYSNYKTVIGYAEVRADQSEAVRIEGMGLVKFYKSKISGKKNAADKTDRDWNVILTKGTSSYGDSCFYMEGGTLQAENSGMFYTESTSSKILLNNIKIKTKGNYKYFLKVIDRKGKMSQNSSSTNNSTYCELIARDQKMTGDIICGTGCGLSVRMKDRSTLTGAIICKRMKSSGQSNYCEVSIGRDSIWIVTGNSRVTFLNNFGTIKDKLNKIVTIKDSCGRIISKGNSSYSITADSYIEEGKAISTDMIESLFGSFDQSE